MELTDEQVNIVKSKGNIKINAIAGSGKTSSLVAYAKERANFRILYLAFNKSVKTEAINKFQQEGLKNVQVETAHSLAYRHVVRNSKYRLTTKYTTFQLKDILKIRPFGEKMNDFILANHVNKFVNYFCNNNALQVKDLNYLEIVNDPQAQEFVEKYYDKIEQLTRIFLSKMNKAEIDIIHDFYLKKFQLSSPVLDYDFILFDEGQDASPTMLDIFLKQKATKVIVGDIHQQIYGWRYAINSLDKVDFENFYLTQSFRFDNEIAQLATKILETKRHFSEVIPSEIKGMGPGKNGKSHVTLARTNMALLVKAIEFITEDYSFKKVYFEGNINSYTYAEDGGSIYDVLNLYHDNKKLIRDKLIRSMRDFEQLEEYAGKTEDAQLKMIIQVVRKYTYQLPSLIQELKSCHVGDAEKYTADMVFSTVHKSKGMEYDEVILQDDFISEEKIEKILSDKDLTFDAKLLSEEVNMLYVAVTRTKRKLRIPYDLLPLSEKLDFKKYKTVVVENAPYLPQEKKGYVPKYNSNDDFEAGEGVIERPKKSGFPWTEDDDDQLTEMFCLGDSIDEIAAFFERSENAILYRITKLELREKYLD